MIIVDYNIYTHTSSNIQLYMSMWIIVDIVIYYWIILDVSIYVNVDYSDYIVDISLVYH